MEKWTVSVSIPADVLLLERKIIQRLMVNFITVALVVVEGLCCWVAWRCKIVIIVLIGIILTLALETNGERIKNCLQGLISVQEKDTNLWRSKSGTIHECAREPFRSVVFLQLVHTWYSNL